jgi:D-alanyl-D-alanine carboxypeptidase/D-alanyl-D-alanine-endopeptidase (penicillin-binding protein 4)
MKFKLFVFGSIFLFESCTSIQKFTKNELGRAEAFKQSITGFSLYDISEKKTLAAKNEDKFFTPASNTKLFSLYAGLKMLSDSVPALKYIVKSDSLIFWGTGDPTFLHPDLKSTKAFDFLKNRKEKLFFSANNNKQPTLGDGWTWNDYNEYYQAEINSFPVYGNIVRFSLVNNQLKASPLNIIDFSEKNKTGFVIRDKNSNLFSTPNGTLKKNFEQDVPFITTIQNTISLLADTLKKPVYEISSSLPRAYKSIYSIHVDTLYKRMMHVSDNMLAEQLILLSSKSDTLSSQKSINDFLKTHLADLPDKPRWVDGSGLSRYNLFSPRSIIKLLEKMYTEFPKERLFKILPASGQNGTLKNMFKGSEPFIYAKSGSLSNNYNLSGYLIGKSGKTYAFSFMNNHYMNSTSDIKKEVERILTELRGKL